MALFLYIMKRLFNKDHYILAFLAMVILSIFALLALNLTFFNPVQRVIYNFSLSDVYYQIMQDTGNAHKSELITIVDATQLYDRREIGDLMEEVSKCEPAVVGVDCIYEGFRGDTLGSNRLAEGVFSLKNAIYAFKLVNFDYEEDEFKGARHSFFTIADGLTEGYSNIRYDRAGMTVRKMMTQMKVNGDTVHSLPYMVARAYSPDVEDFNNSEEHLIDFTPTEFPVVPCDSVAEYAHLLKDRIVYIGATHDDTDMQFCPYGRTPGTIIQAYATQTILEHHRTIQVPRWIVLIISFFIVVLTDIMQTELAMWTKRQKNIWVRVVFSTVLFKNIVNLIWILVLIYLNFMLFYLYELYFDPTILLFSIALLVDARLFYDSAKEAYKTHYLKKQQKQQKQQP